MAQSGVSVDDACVLAFESMKSKRAYKYVTFKLSANMDTIVVDEKLEQPSASEAVTTDEDYEQFYQHLKTVQADRDCRYAVYDMQYQTSEGGRRQKLAFIHFCPDEASIKRKMLYASSKDALKEKLIGTLEIQASDLEGVTLSEIRDKCLKSTTYKWPAFTPTFL